MWTCVTAAATFLLGAAKAKTGAALANPVLRSEGRVTLVDGIRAVGVTLGFVSNSGLGWSWADPAAGDVWPITAPGKVMRP